MVMVSSFMVTKFPEGDRLAYTLSETDAKGHIINENIKGNFVILDTELQDHVEAIKKYVMENEVENE